MNKPKRRASIDSLLLALVRVVSIVSGIVNTAVLSHSLPIETYGTYTQTLLIATLIATFTVFGLLDAMNYFYNSNSSRIVQETYITSIILLNLTLGLLAFGIVWFSRVQIANYFENSRLTELVFYMVLSPLGTNLLGSLQVLLVSNQKARSLAIRNLLIAVIKLSSVWIFAQQSTNLIVLFSIFIMLDVASILWFVVILRNSGIRIFRGRVSLIPFKKILFFAFPMGIYVATNTLSRQIDRLAVGWHESIETYAVYFNASTFLPVDIIAVSFLTVLVPIVTRLIASRSWPLLEQIFRAYLRIGYITTITACVTLFLVAPEIISFLFGAKYLEGTSIFRVYLLSSMVRFASMTFILTAAARTKQLMFVSLATLALNAALSYGSLPLVGVIGPASSAVFSALVSTVVLLHLSKTTIYTSFGALFPKREILHFAITLVTSVVFSFGVGYLLREKIDSSSARAFLVATLFLLMMGFFNLKALLKSMREINQIASKDISKPGKLP